VLTLGWSREEVTEGGSPTNEMRTTDGVTCDCALTSALETVVGDCGAEEAKVSNFFQMRGYWVYAFTRAVLCAGLTVFDPENCSGMVFRRFTQFWE